MIKKSLNTLGFEGTMTKINDNKYYCLSYCNANDFIIFQNIKGDYEPESTNIDIH